MSRVLAEPYVGINLVLGNPESFGTLTILLSRDEVCSDFLAKLIAKPTIAVGRESSIQY